MVGNHHRNGVSTGLRRRISEGLAAQAGQRADLTEQRMRRCAAQENDQSWLDERNLSLQIGCAGCDLGRLRCSIVGRTTLHGVGDVDILAPLQVDRREHCIE
ncbi:MAG: hypothetical protein CAPSK01_002604 [Candidatus Accumulibacter vicinus]|uniref:Uncharacterized protein n=1 Tax=Candidatus Accumulibacter vicinus TaxID=2954382 RepID=A0A084XZW8_9PROT|nr:MAG: hypothetical protein CAPSK01_002604 [Candidatus Accumulibacter vicinus]